MKRYYYRILIVIIIIDIINNNKIRFNLNGDKTVESLNGLVVEYWSLKYYVPGSISELKDLIKISHISKHMYLVSSIIKMLHEN